jgi:putative membrane protein
MSNYKLDWGKPQRQSAFVIAIAVLQVLKTLWPFALLFLANKLFTIDSDKKTPSFIYGLLGTAVVIAVVKLNEVLQYFTTKFYIANHHFIITKGLFVKTQTTIPLNNIQSIQSTQAIVHRLSNTYKIIIDTPGTNVAEVSLLAISAVQFTELQQWVAHHNQQLQATPLPNDASNTMVLHFSDIIRLAISENHLRTLFFIVVIVIGKLQDVKDYFGIDSLGYVADKTSTVANNNTGIFIVLSIVLVITLLVSFVKVLLRFYNMQIVQQAKGLAISWGLLSTQKKYIPVQKMQLLIWHANGIRRLLNLHILRVFAKAENEAKGDTHIHLAITNTQQLQLLQQTYLQHLPALRIGKIQPHITMPIRQILLISLPIYIIATAITAYFFKWYALAWLLWLLYSIGARFISRKNFKVHVYSQYIQIQKGVWGRENILLTIQQVQHVAVATTPYKRSKGFADIVLYNGGQTVTIPYLNATVANQLANYILYCIEAKEHTTDIPPQNIAVI